MSGWWTCAVHRDCFCIFSRHTPVSKMRLLFGCPLKAQLQLGPGFEFLSVSRSITSEILN